MEKTWIANFLPKDEYREKRLLYFIAEAAFILGTLLFLYLIIDSFITKMNVPGDMIVLLSFGFLITYITLRSTLTGIEYPGIITEKGYKREKRSKLYRSIHALIIFMIAYILVKGIPSNLESIFDMVVPAAIASIFLFILNYLSLKKAYKKNRQLMDD